jgi:hypothetical protein
MHLLQVAAVLFNAKSEVENITGLADIEISKKRLTVAPTGLQLPTN